MRLSTPCMQCGFPSDGMPPDFSLYSVPVRDDSLYEFTCRRGHRTVTIVQEERFEILFEIAINAIADGYYREAVASATSSLERFYELFVRLVCRVENVDSSDFEKAWKYVKTLSERQLGMFVAAHVLYFKKAPVLMPSDRVAFRNDVVHMGRIPLMEEAVDYVNHVLSLIMPLLLEAKKTMGEAIHDLMMDRLTERTAKLGQIKCATMTISSVVSLSRAVSEPHPTSISERLAKIEAKKFIA